MKTEFKKWFDSLSDDTLNIESEFEWSIRYLNAKSGWNAAIDRCWDIMRQYDDDTVLKMRLDELKK